MKVDKLDGLFGVELSGVDLALEPDGELIALVERLMSEHALLVIRDQGHIGDEGHIRFSRAFGPLELPPAMGKPRVAKRRFRPELYDASNLDEEGEIAPADALRHKFSKGNETFHADSSFNDLPTKWSLLLGHIVTPERGETEFVDARAVYDALADDMKQRIDGLFAFHSFAHSRERGGMAETSAIRDALPPARHPIVRVSEAGRKSLYVGSHAFAIEGMADEQGRALLEELLGFASQPRFIHAHKWRQGDLVVWDNRCTLHRATEFSYLEHKRDLRRTTINEYGEERSSNGMTQTAQPG